MWHTKEQGKATGAVLAYPRNAAELEALLGKLWDDGCESVALIPDGESAVVQLSECWAGQWWIGPLPLAGRQWDFPITVMYPARFIGSTFAREEQDA